MWNEILYDQLQITKKIDSIDNRIINIKMKSRAKSFKDKFQNTNSNARFQIKIKKSEKLKKTYY